MTGKNAVKKCLEKTTPENGSRKSGSFLGRDFHDWCGYCLIASSVAFVVLVLLPFYPTSQDRAPVAQVEVSSNQP